MDDILNLATLQESYAKSIDHDLEAYIKQCIARVAGADEQCIAMVGANLALEACRAGSAGVSLLDRSSSTGHFNWTALTGLVFDLKGGQSPRHDSACGDCLDRREAFLFRSPAQRYAWMQNLAVIVDELLVAPLFDSTDTPLGTVWVVHHSPMEHFDATDMHYLELIVKLMQKHL